MTKRPRVYKPVDPQVMGRRIQEGGFDEALRLAYGGELAPLHEYLRAFLPADHAERIAEFHQRRLRRDVNRPSNPATIAARGITAIAKNILKQERARNGGRVPKGGYRRAVDRATEWLAVDGELNGVEPPEIERQRQFMMNTLRRRS